MRKDIDKITHFMVKGNEMMLKRRRKNGAIVQNNLCNDFTY